jgi:Rho-type GTPase-activating protein 1/2
LQRTSKQYIDGLTVAQTEYDKELKARRDAEAEVTRLRVLVSGQAARLTAQSGDVKQHKLREQLSKQLYEKLTGLEQDFSKLRVERDMTVMEMEELSASKACVNTPSFLHLLLLTTFIQGLQQFGDTCL